MSGENQRHNDYEIRFGGDGRVEMETDGLSVVSEFITDKSRARTTMSPVNLFFASFGL